MDERQVRGGERGGQGGMWALEGDQLLVEVSSLAERTPRYTLSSHDAAPEASISHRTAEEGLEAAGGKRAEREEEGGEEVAEEEEGEVLSCSMALRIFLRWPRASMPIDCRSAAEREGRAEPSIWLDENSGEY